MKNKSDLKREQEKALRKARPMRVRRVHQYSENSAYPVCPGCHRTMEREYQYYCDRCGQCLDWDHFEDAVVIWGGESRVSSEEEDDDELQASEDHLSDDRETRTYAPSASSVLRSVLNRVATHRKA